jgi:hypothetical protein
LNPTAGISTTSLGPMSGGRAPKNVRREANGMTGRFPPCDFMIADSVLPQFQQ